MHQTQGITAKQKQTAQNVKHQLSIIENKTGRNSEFNFVSHTMHLFSQVTGWSHVPHGYIVSSMEDEAGPGFGFTSFDTFMSSRQRYRPLLVGILWGSFLLMKTFRYDVMIWHCSYVWWSMNMNYKLYIRHEAFTHHLCCIRLIVNKEALFTSDSY
jgi:hypothetical protein